MIWPNEEYRCGDVTLCATLAIPFGPDDMTQLGYVLKVDGKVDGGPIVYFTGDTRYHEVLASCVAPQKPDV